MKITNTIHSGRKQRGMSLLEMVCTVSIMGGLSATALPHFADLPGDARKSVVMCKPTRKVKSFRRRK